jgi:hypothetical protein
MLAKKFGARLFENEVIHRKFMDDEGIECFMVDSKYKVTKIGKCYIFNIKADS